MNNLFRGGVGFSIILLFVSCQSYTPMAFEPKEILSELKESRKLSSSGKTFKFSDAEKLMSERNRILKHLKLEYEKLQKISEIKTPLPNPTLEVGPAFGSRLGETSASSTQPFVGLGFSIPLGPRLARNDDLNKAKAFQAYNNIVIEHRQLYFELREAYVNYQLSKQMLEVIGKLQNTLQVSKKTTEKLIEIGSATKLGLSQVKLQIKELKIQEFEYKSILEESIAKLALLVDAEPATFKELKVQSIELEEIRLPFEKVSSISVDNNLELAKEEMLFHLSDYELKLELAKQYPDLNIGISSEDEVGEKMRTISIPFSIELPVFDRNQQAISEAFSNRQISLESYKTVLAQTLTVLEQSFKQYQNSRSKNNLMEKELLPLSQETVLDAEKSLKFGSIDVLRYLDLVTQNQRYQLEAISLQKDLWEKVIALEKTAGVPLVKFTENDPGSLQPTFKQLVK